MKMLLSLQLALYSFTAPDAI